MDAEVIIVGAGAAGLTAARRLQELGVRDFLLVERETRVGGRLATDAADGFLFDRGFQVLQTAYPTVRRWLDLDRLDTAAFEPGAQVFLPRGEVSHVFDPLRRPLRLPAAAMSPVGSFLDKLQLLRLVAFVRTRSSESLFDLPESSTIDFLRGFGFGESLIERFFRPFYGGVFLERELETSNRLFLFTFKMFAEGEAVLPKGGIQAVAEQLADPLAPERQLLGHAVERIGGNRVELADGRVLRARHIVDSRPNSAENFGSGIWHGTVVVYFTGDSSGISERMLGLVPGGCPVGLVTELSAVQPSYAPSGKTLISVSLQAPSGRDLDFYVSESMKSLAPWFADVLPTWTPLRHYSLSTALPLGEHTRWTRPPVRDASTGAWLAGDATLAPSLQHAMRSGELVAEAIAARTPSRSKPPASATQGAPE